MRMHASDGAGLPNPLAHRLPQAGNATEVAGALAAVWKDVDLALGPVIGQRGVVALFNRSVHLSAAAHPWLAPAHQDPEAALDLAPLQSTVSRQELPHALAAAHHLLSTFQQLLVSLIGPSLTERLLRAAWGPPLHGGAASQDPST